MIEAIDYAGETVLVAIPASQYDILAAELHDILKSVQRLSEKGKDIRFFFPNLSELDAALKTFDNLKHIERYAEPKT